MLLSRLVSLLLSRRWIVASLIIGLSAIAIYGTTQLKFDDDPRHIFRTSGEELVTLQKQFEDFGADDGSCILVVEAPDFFQPDTMRAFAKLVEEIRGVHDVDRAQSMLDARRPGIGRAQIPLIPLDRLDTGNLARAKQRALANPLVAGQLLSDDGQTSLIIAQLDPSCRGLAQIDPVLQAFNRIIEPINESGVLNVRVTGVPAVRAEIVKAVRSDLTRFNAVGCIAATVIAAIMFRRWNAVVIAVAAPALGSLWISGLLGLLGISINVINSVVPTLVLVIGLTDSVHFLVDMRRSRSARLNQQDTTRAAVAHVGAACGITSLTTAIGFASLAVARSEIIRSFGLTCAAGSIICFFTVLLVVPWLANSWLGKNLEAPQRTGRSWAAKISDGLVAFVSRHAMPVAGVGVVCTIGLVFVAMELYPDVRLTENLPPRSEAAQALDHCDQVFGGVSFVHALVEWPEAEGLASAHTHEVLKQVQQTFAGTKPLRAPLSVLNLADSLPNVGSTWKTRIAYIDRSQDPAIQRFLGKEHRRALVSAHVPDIGAHRLAPTYVQLRAALGEIERKNPGYHVKLSGTTVFGAENVTRMIQDLGNSLGLESLIIFGLMTWAFRSFGLGLISIIPNIFPLVAVASFIVFSGMPLQLGSVIVFNICLGLAVDDTIHVMSRFRRELESEGEPEWAVRRSFQAVGTAVLTTTAILMTGFASVMLSRVPALQLFGRLSCITLLAALLAELVFTPALLIAYLRLRSPRILKRLPANETEAAAKAERPEPAVAH